MRLIQISFLSLFCFVQVQVFPQNNNFQILEDVNGLLINIVFGEEQYILEGEQSNVINYFNSINESEPGSPILPLKTYIIAIPPDSKIRIRIKNETYNYISSVIPKSNPEVSLSRDSSLIYSKTNLSDKYYNYAVFPTNQFSVEGYTWIRDYYCAVIKVNTHRYDWNKREVIELVKATLEIEFLDVKPFSINTFITGEFDKSLEKVIINFKEANNFRSFPPNSTFGDSTGSWIDYSKEYVKLQIPEDGIYRIDYDALINYAVDPQLVDPTTFKVFSKGNQISLFIFGEDDHSFDQGDYIEFWAEKNYGSSNYREIVPIREDYLNYLDRYSDTTIVWLTWDGTTGKRAGLIDSYTQGVTDTISSHLVKIHLEEDTRLWYYGFDDPRVQLPFWQENKIWTWLQVSNSGTSSFPFYADSIVPNTNVYSMSRLISWFADQIITNAHKYGAKLNSTGMQDSVTFDFETTANLVAAFNSSELIEGENNYRISGMPNQNGTTHKALVDWVDIDYFQYLKASNDSILIRVPDSVSSGIRVLKISNVLSDSASMFVYKVKPEFKKVTSFLKTGNVLAITDTISGGNEYFMINNSYLKTPKFVAKKQFLNLRETNRQADYILISHKTLQSSAINYSNFIRNNYNLNVETIFVDDVYNEFGYGYTKPEPIKELLKYAYSNWQSPKPSFLVLLGDCTYDYKNLFTSVPSPRKQILVPSYGNPVSDVWFTTWDSTNINIQQMYVGRVPANDNEEVYRYLDKHQVYINRVNDEWNKKFILFSGGYPEYPSELEQIKEANDNVLNNIIRPAPVGGEAIHFYKTITPPTNFGPYTLEEIQNGLDEGGLFISYVGHSGTRTWDNGVSEVDDIKNAYTDRYPLISDNGCSTGKFAEPDIEAFGELFVNQDARGQAITYMGNSSLGYTSTAFRIPKVFYKRLIVDSTQSIGEAHFLTKIDNFNSSGFSDVNRVYNYCNLLLGDPIIKFATPEKPDFVVNQNSVKFQSDLITDIDDSTNVKLIISNWGRVVPDSLENDIQGVYLDSSFYNLHLLVPSPLFNDSLQLTIPILGLAGEHTINVELDKRNLIEELSEENNSAHIQFLVFSTKIRPLEAEDFYNTSRTFVNVLNPTVPGNEEHGEIELSIAQNQSFNNQSVLTKYIDTMITNIPLTNLQPDKRYYWRARLKGVEQEWSQTISFYNNYNHSWFINNSFNPNDIKFDQVEFDSLSLGWKLRKGINRLKIASAGFNEGKYASIQYNFLEFVPNTFFRGFATALVDTLDLHPYDVQTFIFPVIPSRDSMISYLNYLSEGDILAIVATDEVSTFFTGTVGDSLKQLLKGFGSAFVDSIGWRDSWAMLGIKGAPQGTVPEAFSKRLQGPAVIDTSKFVQFSNGSIVFPQAENSSKWQDVIKSDSIPIGANVNYIPLAYGENGEVDTLNILQFISNIASIEHIDASVYKKVSILAELHANDNFDSPEIKSLSINFIPPPELGTNYQVVSISSDSVLIGEDVNLNFYVYNVGETKADSFKVKVEIINDDNSRETIFGQSLDSLGTGEKQYFEVSYNTSSGSGSKTFFINIDVDNQVTELYEDNNFYTIPFFIKPDTTTPLMNITFDGYDIVDGDYISDKPLIKTELTDPSLLPITDPSSVEIYLNEVLIPPDTAIINYQFSETNPKVTVEFTPKLADGEYFLCVLGKDASGNLVDSAGVERYFLVSNEAKILYVYNYPNPFKDGTNFTFKLTQIPDEIKIKIFTIAGRLVKEIKLSPSLLNYDFNKIFWDGKDEDGDQLANGVYLYKVIMKAGDKTEAVTQKLAIVR